MDAKKNEAAVSTWRAFLDNHVGELVSIDFFTAPTATFRILFVLIVLAHARRRIVHFNVTEHPTAEWTAQQMVEAFCDGKSPRYLIRDRDGVYGLTFRERVKALAIGADFRDMADELIGLNVDDSFPLWLRRSRGATLCS